MLAKRFENILHDLGMAGLEHPLFYHAPVGIRFKIGGEAVSYTHLDVYKRQGTFRTGTSGGRLPIIFGHTVVWAHSMICPVCAEITTTFLTF